MVRVGSGGSGIVSFVIRKPGTVRGPRSMPKDLKYLRFNRAEPLLEELVERLALQTHELAIAERFLGQKFLRARIEIATGGKRICHQTALIKLLEFLEVAALDQ